MALKKPLVYESGDASVILTGDTVDPAHLATGTRDGTKFLRDDGSYQNIERTIGLVIDAGDDAIVPGVKGAPMVIGFSGTIVGWDIVADAVGSIVIDVWKSAAGTIPSVANTIAGSEKPTLSAQQINSDVALSTWTIAVVKGQVIRFNVDSASTVKKVTLTLRVVG